MALLKIMEICTKFSSNTDLADMDANALNYWLGKFVQEVANSEGKVYPAMTLYGIICGIRRHLEETVGCKALNPLDSSDKRYEMISNLCLLQDTISIEYNN